MLSCNQLRTATAPNLFLMVASLSCVFALVFSATRQMNNVTYTNALDGTVLTHRGEHFEVVSAPFTLQYAEALHEFSPPLELPPAVVARFKDRVMAITGYETNWEIRTPSGWRAAKCTEAYTHHYQLYLFSSKADAETVNRNLHPNDDYPPTPRATSRAGRGGFTPPLAQAFFEGNGNENRGSFHGLPAGLAQFIDSPAYFRNLYHVINTRPPSGNASWGEGTDGPLPRSSAAAPGAPYSGLVECPCSTRRGDYRRTGVLAVDAPANETGQKFRALCNPAGSLLKVGNPICGHATYSGGLQCCDQGMVMLDADQAIPPAPSTYRYRLRFYFEGDAPSPSPPPREAFFLFAETEDWQSEFDVPALPPPSVHTLRRDFVAAELFGGLLGWNSPHRFNCSRVYTAMCGGREEVQRAGGNFELR